MLDADELDTILACANNDQTGRVTAYELRELVSGYRRAIQAVGPEPAVALKQMIERIAATSIWHDIYPDGPDMMNGGYSVTPDDIRACRSALVATSPTEPVVEALREAQRVLILASKHRITIEPDTLKMIDAALSGSGPGWPVPDGWKLVPVEPDDAMIEAGQDTCEEKNSWGGRVYASDIWESMLAASPAAPQQGGE